MLPGSSAIKPLVTDNRGHTFLKIVVPLFYNEQSNIYESFAGICR